MNERICFPYEDVKHNIQGFVGDIEEIHSKMLDSVSQDIFSNRLLFSLTGNHKYLRNILLRTAGGKNLYNIFSDNTPKYIYGAGIRGKRLAELFPELNWNGLIDKNSSFKNYNDIGVFSIEQFLKNYKYGTKIIISNMIESQEIFSDLLEKGVFQEDIYVLNDFNQENEKNMYFLSECSKILENSDGAFVDVGCYDGKDSISYLQRKNKNAKIFAFEPDTKNYKVCFEKLQNYQNIKLFNIGLSNIEEELNIAGEGEMAHLGSKGDLSVHTQLLDHILGQEDISFIKMDVEGYEENVISGAKTIIREQHPVLAISIYHKRSDIWCIPKLVLDLNNNYLFYLRHYSVTNGDTVLYAIDKSSLDKIRVEEGKNNDR